MTETTISPNPTYRPIYRPTLTERLRVRWQNWKVRKVGKAMRVIGKDIQTDPGYRQTWHANIAMTIYDSTADQPAGPIVSHIDQANYIADKLLKHFFGIEQQPFSEDK